MPSSRPSVARPTHHFAPKGQSSPNTRGFAATIVERVPRRSVANLRVSPAVRASSGGREGPPGRRLLLGLPLCLPQLGTSSPQANMGQSLSASVSEGMAKGCESRSTQDDCVFCQIAKEGPLSTRVLYQDERIVAFPDRSPAAASHILVIPREHIAHGYCLAPTDEDRQLVADMVALGKSLLESKHGNGAELKFGFHMPPLNSVNHLHLHCFALPHEPAWKAVKYTDMTAWGRLPVVVGFISAENMLSRLGGDFPPQQRNPPTSQV